MSTLTIAAIQYDIQWLATAQNLATLANQLNGLDKQVDLVLLPETFATGFSIRELHSALSAVDNPVVAWMQNQASQLKATIAGSVLTQQGDKMVNRFYWVNADGVLQYYDKRHLFRMGQEDEVVLPGQRRVIIELNQVRLLATVCYDLRFPVWSRNQNDYDILINVANWPAVRRQAWDTLLRARAIENQCYVVGVNRVGADGRKTEHNGGTCVIDFLGNTLAAVADNQSGIILQTLDINALTNFRNQFPCHLDADKFTIQL